MTVIGSRATGVADRRYIGQKPFHQLAELRPVGLGAGDLLSEKVKHFPGPASC
jgi:hypothetical protein